MYPLSNSYAKTRAWQLLNLEYHCRFPLLMTLAQPLRPAAAPAPFPSPSGCSGCPIHRLCLPAGIEHARIGELDRVIVRRRRIARDQRLYRSADPFSSLYAVRFGLFKTARPHPGAEREYQITGFQMAGELLGMDAIGTARHGCDAVALEDSEVCEIPFARLAELFGRMPPLLRQFNRTLSGEITREQGVLLLLGSMRAEQRFAVFLVNLAARYAARGYSATTLQLRMSREEIGNHLGLTVESVSRLLSRFRKQGWVSVEHRKLTLLAPAMIEALASGAAEARPV